MVSSNGHETRTPLIRAQTLTRMRQALADGAALAVLGVFAGTRGWRDRRVVLGLVLAALTALVDRSFVYIARTAGGARYRLHETTREFALLPRPGLAGKGLGWPDETSVS